ncbi:hypothetical protein CN272_20980 [Bacillus anthracis]|nr:hypothetical protein CN272_20980 [Bacillus anthracis]
MPKPPPKPPNPPGKKPPSGGGSNTNNCNVLCNAIVSNLALVNALNVGGGSISVHLEYDEVPGKGTTITVTSVNLQTCTIQGTDEATGVNKTVTCAFALANFTDMKIN